MSTRAQENVWDYPRPPALEPAKRRLRVIWKAPDGTEHTIADTTEGYRVLETSHPPTYYLPPSSVQLPLQPSSHRQTYCEWKGIATYHDFTSPSGTTVKNRIWSYQQPTPSFVPIAGYLSFYASAWSTTAKSPAQENWICMVDDEVVTPQDGDFYGGWKTSEIIGKMKGARGTEGW